MNNIIDVVNNIDGISEREMKAIVTLYDGIVDIFNGNDNVKTNLLDQIRDNFKELRLANISDSGYVSSLSSCITLSSDLEVWNYINTFMHELIHLISKNQYIDENMFCTQYNLGMKLSNHDQMDALFGPSRLWKVDDNNYTFDRGEGLLLFDEWLTEWLANKFSGMKNVELTKNNDGFFKVKTSHGYDGSNIMNLLELTYGSDVLIDLFTGLSYSVEERKNIIPLLGFHRMNEMYDSNIVLSEKEKNVLLSKKHNCFKNPNITIALVNYLSEYNCSDNDEHRNFYLREMMNLLLKTYEIRFNNILEKGNKDNIIELYYELMIIQHSLIWNEDIDLMNNQEYYVIFNSMISKFIEHCREKNYEFNYSKLMRNPNEIYNQFVQENELYGHQLDDINKKHL